ncbi:hypothetical protein [Moritella sp. 28]|uniref:hypothetical protein n=1 Tax=Moritella sp. 28 TaxID=2746232 RepID=UPI001BAB6779|nr:hypothetical protein [Moritella sp. 28]QUM85461.1 hypothetical protein HWV02_13575 [Moritella sp. 28]
MSEVAELSSLERVNVINERIKPRLREIELCGKVSQFMFDNNCHDGVASFTKASFTLNGEEFYSGEHSRQLTDPILDSGIAMVRVMLQLLGVSVDKNNNFFAYDPKPGDIVMSSFGLVRLPLHNKPLDYLSNNEIMVLKLAALNGNKGVAHLTIHETKSIPLDQLSTACQTIIKLVEKHLVNPILNPEAT